MSTLSELANYFDALPDEVEEETNEVAIEIALAVVERLAYSTPVDTSYALSNWVIQYTPVQAPRGAHAEGEKGSTLTISARATVRAAQTALGAKQPGQTIYIGNAAPYIQDLEYGSSPQASFFAEAASAYGNQLAREYAGAG